MKNILIAFLYFFLTSCNSENNPSNNQGNGQNSIPLKGEWAIAQPFLGTPRTGAVSFTIGEAVYIGLGYNLTLGITNTVLNDFWMYKDSKWTRIADFPGEGRYGAVAFVINGIAYVGTGFNPERINNPENYYDDFYTYDPGSGKWSNAPVTHLPENIAGEKIPRYDGIAFSLGNKGYVGTGSYQSKTIKDLYCFDGTTWTTIGFPGDARQGASVFVIDNKAVICLGTSNREYGKYLCDVNIYDGTTNSWNTDCHPLVDFTNQDDDSNYDQIPRAYAVAFTSAQVEGKMKGYIATGFGPHPETCWEYDIEKDHWEQVSSMPTETYKRVSAIGFSIHNYGYITTGGQTFGSPLANDMWSFIPGVTSLKD